MDAKLEEDFLFDDRRQSENKYMYIPEIPEQ
jgi:hypothetical protein